MYLALRITPRVRNRRVTHRDRLLPRSRLLAPTHAHSYLGLQALSRRSITPLLNPDKTGSPGLNRDRICTLASSALQTPDALRIRSSFDCVFVSLDERPLYFPAAFAIAIPSLCRSKMSDRSNSAKTRPSQTAATRSGRYLPSSWRMVF